MPNSTTVTEFLLTRFSDVWQLRVLHAMLFLLMYLATLMVNFLIVTVTILNQSLHIPMYFFLRNLSVLDMCSISVTVPKHVSSSCLMTVISMVGCAAQIFLVLFFAITELLFLTIMALDHYVAICQPLHYPLIMNPWFCVQMTLPTLISGVAFSGFHTGNTFRLPFCQSNVVHQFFCEVPSLLNLYSSEISSNEILILIAAVLTGGGCFTFITMSYIHIFSTVLKLPNGEERARAFSTCVPHILMVTVFLSSGAAVYVKPNSSSPTIQDMIISVLYSVVPPFLNLIIYSLRNKQIKEALRRIMSRKFYWGK